MSTPTASLVLRLAAPLQSWGGRSQYNRRDTQPEPTKSGVLGLLAAAQGRRRQDPIDDLLDLRLGVRTDQPGSLLRDYHTVSDYRGTPLPSAAVARNSTQEPTSPAKYTHVTERFYLQDAVFVVAVGGPTMVLTGLRAAVRSPAFPLALGRRACVPTQPLVLEPDHGQHAADGPGLWAGDPLTALQLVPWQGSGHRLDALGRSQPAPAHVDLPLTVDDPAGDDVRVDLPTTFDPQTRAFITRRVRQAWVHLPTPFPSDGTADAHDPFALLGW